ncbi:hypothetical protein ACHHYP_20317 [Achlya hypogyna]|uniref:Uncharacterized protein n=1 Tax=Achlya hypogyna TaxID=1202772 RepID=A0A1V9ZMT9_ACHHY|nr:hypothetical protein ACHHYP_20317 [Achlya hypogyna]
MMMVRYDDVDDLYDYDHGRSADEEDELSLGLLPSAAPKPRTCHTARKRSFLVVCGAVLVVLGLVPLVLSLQPKDNVNIAPALWRSAVANGTGIDNVTTPEP